MKNAIIITSLFALTGCVTAPLAQDQREVTFVEQTSAKQKDAYNAILGYLAKNLGDSNFAIKVKDPEAGTIITQIAFDCDELRSGFIDVNRHSAIFNLEVGTKDNKVRIVFEALNYRVYNAVGGRLITEQNFTPDKIAAMKPCIDREKVAILASISGSKGANW